MTTNLKPQIQATIASFRNLPATIPIGKSVVIFWESHTKNLDDKKKTQATIDLIPKKFDLSTCEKYEVRTGYLSRYNYLPKPKEQCTIEELEEAIVKGEEEQEEWIKRCNPKLENFVQINWQECVSKIKNPHFVSCRDLLMKNINENESFYKAYKESSCDYAIKRNTNEENGFSYLVEENAWILTLPYLYPNKQIYIVHVGNVTDSTILLFSTFEYLRESTRLLFPHFDNKNFANLSDFKQEYRSKQNCGYFVEDKELVNIVANAKKESDLSKKDLLKLLIDERAEKELLSSIIAKMPGHVYWINNRNIYMGCNDMQAKHVGLSSRNEIVGKTVFDFLPDSEAKSIHSINKLVIEKGRIYSGEEKASMNNGFRTYLSHKSPLINSSGKIIGLLGISIDISDRKAAAELQSQNKLQRIELQEREKIKKLFDQVSHDIRSPLASLSMFAQECKHLAEKERVMLRNTVSSIEIIVSTLLEKYKENDKKMPFIRAIEKYVCIYWGLKDVLDRERMKYKETKIIFNYTLNPKYKFVFIKGSYTDFCRMMSNLLNNAVEAILPQRARREGGGGVIDINFVVKEGKVELSVKDNGKGMPKEMVDNILNDIEVGSTKETGHGIGIEQIKSTLKMMKAQMQIKSTENIGTEFTFIFSQSELPKWFADRIVLNKGDIVVVIDEDISIHEAWKTRFEKYLSDITVKYFEQSSEALNFIGSIKEKNKVFILTDYELKDEEINGIDVIDKCELQKRAIVVTNRYISKIKDFNEKSKAIRFFYKEKEYIDDIPVLIKDMKSSV